MRSTIKNKLTNPDRIAFADELGGRGLGQEYKREMLEEDLKTLALT